MDDEIAFIQFAEIDLRAIARRVFRRAANGAGRASVARPKISAAERTTRFAAGKTETARERSFDQLKIADLDLRVAMISRKRSISPSVWK